MSVFKSKLVWIQGPYPASTNNLAVFRQSGLKDKLKDGQRAVADNGYHGKTAIATPNQHDSAQVCKFKSRARA